MRPLQIKKTPYHKVPSKRIWQFISTIGIERKLIRTIKSLYQNNENYVGTTKNENRKFLHQRRFETRRTKDHSTIDHIYQ